MGLRSYIKGWFVVRRANRNSLQHQLTVQRDMIADINIELSRLKRRVTRLVGHVQVYDASLEQTQKLFGAECERARAQTDRVIESGLKSYTSLNKRVCAIENHVGIESPLAKAMHAVVHTDEGVEFVDEDSVPELLPNTPRKGGHVARVEWGKH